MKGTQYKGKFEMEGEKYKYSAVVHSPNEITTLIIEGSSLTQPLVSFGHVYDEDTVLDAEMVRDCARGTTSFFTSDVFKDLHKSVTSEIHASPEYQEANNEYMTRQLRGRLVSVLGENRDSKL